jgi:hypothetical protein
LGVFLGTFHRTRDPIIKTASGGPYLHCDDFKDNLLPLGARSIIINRLDAMSKGSLEEIPAHIVLKAPGEPTPTLTLKHESQPH